MARSKTFADGEILTPADVNDHLVNHVPNVGDAYDTGWVFFMNTAVQISGRRIGRTVTIRVVINATGLTGNVIQVESGAAVVPVGFRPHDVMWGAGEGTQPGVGYTPVTFKFLPDGKVEIIKPATATEYLYGSVTYVV